MMPSHRTTVLDLELQIPPIVVKPSNSTILHRIVDYIAAKGDKSDAGEAVVWFA